MPIYVEVAVNIPGRVGTFDYHLPVEMETQAGAGSLVVVPFGKQRVQGVILRRKETPSVFETRAVEVLLDELPVVTAAQMALAHWLANETLAPLSACLDLMLPPGLSQLADLEYRLNPAVTWEEKGLKPTQTRIVAALKERGPLRGRQIEHVFPHHNWKNTIQEMVRKGWVISRPVLPEPEIRPRTARMVGLGVPADEQMEQKKSLGQPNSAAFKRRKAVLDFLAHEPAPVDVSWVYAQSGANSADLHRLAGLGLVRFYETEIWRDPLSKLDVLFRQPPPLTQDQAQVWARVQAGLRDRDSTGNQPFLLHGVTGSGKTEIYLRAVAEVLAQGRQAIVLVPEIALTPQAVQRFLARFPGQVGLMHSKLTHGERYDTWRRARSGQIGVMVGARSALFSPFPDLGLIILDECHDSSYYQAEPAPAYHALSAAITYGKLSRSLVLFGSATPEIATAYQFNREGWPVLKLPVRILAHQKVTDPHITGMGIQAGDGQISGDSVFLPLPPVEVVDMRQELKAGNRSIFSRALKVALADVLNKKQQAILFLNRLGSASYVFCRNCGYTLHCPRCDRTLTFHNEDQLLICHTCNYHRKMPSTCPQCRSEHIRQFGAGTERVVDELQKQFPAARALRWDSQATRQKGSHDQILEDFTRQRADVLVGTQMVAKGLDFALVTLVGVVLADVGLFLDDYRAGERTFQLLTQVAGRAGRSPLGGKAILQTFQPEHFAIQTASRHDYQAFYRREIEERRKIGYPPFARLARLELRHPSRTEAELLAKRMADQVLHWIGSGGFNETEIIGPVPCFFTRQAGQYRWQVIIRGPDPAAVVRGRDLADWRVEIDPQSLL